MMIALCAGVLSTPLVVGRVYSVFDDVPKVLTFHPSHNFYLPVGVVRTGEEMWTNCRVTFMTLEAFCVVDDISSSCGGVIFSHSENPAL